MKNKYFIIGNPSSIWMIEYIKEIHIKNGDEIWITVFNEDDFSEHRFFYEKNNIRLVTLGKSSKKSEKFIKVIRLLHFAFKYKDHFNVIEIHYPPHNFQAYIIAIIMKIMRAKSFVMFWGSDILPINYKESKKLEKIIKNANLINQLSKHTYKKFNELYGDSFDDKFTKKMLKFGTLALPYIESALQRKNKEFYKEKYGIPKSKVTIAVGHNGRKRQQHIKVLEALSLISKDLKEKLYIVLHLVGIDKEYEDEILSELENTQIEYKVIYSNLGLEEISILRIITDIFIHAQTTDGISGSVRESFSAETIVLNPKWIQYDELLEMGIEYIQYNDFSEIAKLLSDIIEGEIIVNKKRNREIINKKYSWESTYSDWIETFDQLVND